MKLRLSTRWGITTLTDPTPTNTALWGFEETRPRGEGDPGGSEYVAGVSDNPLAWFDHDLIDRIRGSGGDVSMSTETREILKAAQEAVNEGRVASITDYLTNPAARAAAESDDETRPRGEGDPGGSEYVAGVSDNPMAWFDHDLIERIRASGVDVSMSTETRETLKAAQEAVNEGRVASITDYVTNPAARAAADQAAAETAAIVNSANAAGAGAAAGSGASPGADGPSPTLPKLAGSNQAAGTEHLLSAGPDLPAQADASATRATWRRGRRMPATLLESQGIDTCEMTDAQMAELVYPVAAYDAASASSATWRSRNRTGSGNWSRRATDADTVEAMSYAEIDRLIDGNVGGGCQMAVAVAQSDRMGYLESTSEMTPTPQMA